MKEEIRNHIEQYRTAREKHLVVRRQTGENGPDFLRSKAELSQIAQSLLNRLITHVEIIDSMSMNQRRVIDFISKIPSQAKDLRDTPGYPPPHALVLSASLMLEEVMETITKGLGVDIEVTIESATDVCTGNLAFENITFIARRDPDMIEIVDGLGDQDVVNNGTAARCGVRMQPVFDEIMDNNDGKVAQGTINELGKLVKPEGYPAPDIKRVLKEQGWEGDA